MKIEITNPIKTKGEKKMTFSKFLAVFSCVLVALVFIDLMIINHKLMTGKLESYDFTAFMYLIPSSFALCAATVAFYYNKSKLENGIKIRYSYVTKLLELKKSMGLYTKEDLTLQIDNYIDAAENGINNQFDNVESAASEDINISI